MMKTLMNYFPILSINYKKVLDILIGIINRKNEIFYERVITSKEVYYMDNSKDKRIKLSNKNYPIFYGFSSELIFFYCN